MILFFNWRAISFNCFIEHNGKIAYNFLRGVIMIVTMIQGLLMALADSVPGVSGSTIAFILGYYEKFLGSIHDLFGKDNESRKEALIWLIKFAVGWVVGMVGAILILSDLFNEKVYALSSLFLGLTLAAIPLIINQEKSTVKGNWWHIVFTIIGAAIVIFLSWLRNTDIGIGAIDFLDLSLTDMIYLVVAGFLAICSMLLPGMSGSSVLLIFGLYVPVVNAVKEILSLNFGYLLGLILLAIGVILGVILASGTIKKALANHRSQMIYLIIGLMIGSLYAIICSPLTLDDPQPALSLSTFNILMFIIGILIIVVLEVVKSRKQN